MQKLFFVLIFLFSFIAVNAQSKDERMIRAAMNEQVNAWNAGDLERYMQTYWHNDSLMFIGRSGANFGWDATLNSYKKGYPDTAAMGKLDFELIAVKRLSALYYNVAGKWHLKRTAGDLKGAFTLLFRKINGRWVIVQDHSS